MMLIPMRLSFPELRPEACHVRASHITTLPAGTSACTVSPGAIGIGFRTGEMAAGNKACATVGYREVGDRPHDIDDDGRIDRVARSSRWSEVPNGARDVAGPAGRSTRNGGARQPPLVRVEVHRLVARMNDVCGVSGKQDKLTEQMFRHGERQWMSSDVVEAAFAGDQEDPLITGEHPVIGIRRAVAGFSGTGCVTLHDAAGMTDGRLVEYPFSHAIAEAAEVMLKALDIMGFAKLAGHGRSIAQTLKHGKPVGRIDRGIAPP